MSSVKALKNVHNAIGLSGLHKTEESDSSIHKKTANVVLHQRKNLHEFQRSESEPVAKRAKIYKRAPTRILPKPQTPPSAMIGGVVQFPLMFYSHQQVMAYACMNAQQYLLSCNQSF